MNTLSQLKTNSAKILSIIIFLMVTGVAVGQEDKIGQISIDGQDYYMANRKDYYIDSSYVVGFYIFRGNRYIEYPTWKWKHGKSTTYFANGNIKKIGRYNFDKKEGQWNHYHPNGNISIESQYKNNLLYGEFKQYDENGKIGAITMYKGGVMSGIFKEYHSNGVIRLKGKYKNDKRVGEWLVYFEDGSISYKGKYNNNGQQHGTWKVFDKNGNVTDIENYVNGIKQNQN